LTAPSIYIEYNENNLELYKSCFIVNSNLSASSTEPLYYIKENTNISIDLPQYSNEAVEM
jgi:hypothetical protein